MCRSPLTIRRKLESKSKGYTNTVPCGKCPQCLKKRQNAWYFRLKKQQEVSTSCLFITLTYNNENLPYSITAKRPSLEKTHTQLWMKRLRKALQKKYPKATRPKLKYYTVGEYGKQGDRPHYHCILFNMPISDISLIDMSWRNGFTTISQVTNARLRYTVKYITSSKKLSHDTYGRQKEFACMSKGLGSNYLTGAMLKYHQSTVDNAHVTYDGGKKMPLPKYYKEKLYTADTKITRLQVTNHLQKLADERENKLINEIMAESRNISYEKAVMILQRRQANVKHEKREQTL